jgi:hypothetical protein
LLKIAPRRGPPEGAKCSNAVEAGNRLKVGAKYQAPSIAASDCECRLMGTSVRIWSDMVVSPCHAKLVLVLVLSGVHGFFSRCVKDFAVIAWMAGMLYSQLGFRGVLLRLVAANHP